jgi:hypothetical protein
VRRPPPPPALALALALAAGACGGGEPAPADPLAGRGAAFAALTADEVDRQQAAGTPRNPLGLVLEGCPVADADAVAAIGAGLPDGDADDGRVLNALLQDPDGERAVQCALGYGSASGGAVVLSVRPRDGDLGAVVDQLADYTPVDDVEVEGLDPAAVAVLDADGFAAVRGVFVGEELEVSVTVNDDVGGADGVAAVLPVAVREVARTLG